MTKDKKEIGAWGEEIAAEWRTEQGYQFGARNLRTADGEIDVIAQQGDITIFVEVKSLSSSIDFFPETRITHAKQQHRFKGAQRYAAEHNIDHGQFDAMAVQGKPGAKPISTHIENAIQAGRLNMDNGSRVTNFCLV